MMSLWDALRMNMMISYQELVRTFLRRNVENGTTIPNSYELKEKMTISIGVYCSKIDDESADKVVSYADAALYEAKNSGRNKVCYYYH